MKTSKNSRAELREFAESQDEMSPLRGAMMRTPYRESALRFLEWQAEGVWTVAEQEAALERLLAKREERGLADEREAIVNHIRHLVHRPELRTVTLTLIQDISRGAHVNNKETE